MKVRVKNIFTTVRAEGAMLPIDLLQRVVENDKNLKGLTPADYHLLEDEKLNEAINRSWSRLRGAWVSFQAVLEKLPEGDVAIKVTRDRFLLPLFHELGYGRLGAAKSLQVSNPNTDAPVRTFPISHIWMNTPIHLVGFGVDLDQRTKGIAGAAKSSPHSLVQEFLNRSDENLWAFVSNGKRLRILRDNASLTRQAYVEFDLEAMMAGEVYADFVLLWLLCHQSRVEAEQPEKCWLEQWSKAANDQGKRALEDLRSGVQTAIERLGQGFLSHAANKALREKLYSGELSTQDYYRQLLRLVYRLLFLFLAEDRDLLLDPQADEAAKDRYRLYYSTAKLRALAERRRGSRHIDLFQGLRLVMEKLGSAQGCPEIGLPALGSFLWSANAVLDLLGHPVVDKPEGELKQLKLGVDEEKAVEPCQISNADFLDAVRVLAFITDRHGRRPVDYKNLQSEELGSVYESLLELHPELNRDAGTFVLETASGNERKTTGSYYTPTSLVHCLLDSALNPVLEEAALKPDAEAAILALKVCDPACGSGHFLIAAAHRIAKRLAFVRTGDEEPSPIDVQRALRDVIGRCVYGVDINPMAVELCKVALWMEAVEPGKPLSFLDHHIQCGNSLIGATPALLQKGIPDEAFKPIKGDDKEYCEKYMRINQEERQGQLKLFDPDRDNMSWRQLSDFKKSINLLDDIDDEEYSGIQRKQQRYDNFLQSKAYKDKRLYADTWCSAFVIEKNHILSSSITEKLLSQVAEDPDNVEECIRQEIYKLRSQYQFFHWHLAFPNIFQLKSKESSSDSQSIKTSKNRNYNNGWLGGFDVFLGNPPWESLKISEQEWFSGKSVKVVTASNSKARKRTIQKLSIDNPRLYQEWVTAKRLSNGIRAFMQRSGLYPLCGKGHVNTYAVFAELARKLKSLSGTIGYIIPTGIVTDKMTKSFCHALIENNEIDSLIDFSNKEFIFPEVKPHQHFCLLTLRSSEARNQKPSLFGFFMLNTDQLHGKTREDILFQLSQRDINLINPNTLTLPVFKTSKDAQLLTSLYKASPILIKTIPQVENPWKIKIRRMFNVSDDADFFVQKEYVIHKKGSYFHQVTGQKLIPLMDAKMVAQYDHRAASLELSGNDYRKIKKVPSKLEEKRKQTFIPETVYWLPSEKVDDKLSAWQHEWLLAFKKVSGLTSTNLCSFAIIPRCATSESFPNVFSELSPEAHGLLLAVLNSTLVEFILRLKMQGLHLNYYLIEQLPFPPPNVFYQPAPWSPEESISSWLIERILELTYTSNHLRPFAKNLGFNGEPFPWDEDRRIQLKCEIDAAIFMLYGLQAKDVEYIFDALDKFKKRDLRLFGEYISKRITVEVFKMMSKEI